MTVLVTGGSGFLGKRTAAYFSSLGYRVLTPSHRELDITDAAALRCRLREDRPDAVIHTAAVSDTGLCQREPAWSEAINVGGAVNLITVCKELGCKPVLCSSDQVYSGSALPGPHRETEPVTPNTVYGVQKLLAEEKCLELFPETVCLRLSWMYAKENFPHQHGHFLTTLKAALADETKPLTWPVHDRRGITDVDAVVRNLPAVLKLPGGVYNFGAENDACTYDTVKDLLERLGLTDALARLTPNGEAFRDNPRDISMDTAKIREAGIRFPATVEGLMGALQEEEWT